MWYSHEKISASRWGCAPKPLLPLTRSSLSTRRAPKFCLPWYQSAKEK